MTAPATSTASGSISPQTPLLWLTATLVAFAIGDAVSRASAATRSPTRW